MWWKSLKSDSCLLLCGFCFPFWKNAKESSLLLHGHPGVMLVLMGGTLCQVVRSGDSATGAWGQTWVYFPRQASVQKHPRQRPPGADQTKPGSSARRTAENGQLLSFNWFGGIHLHLQFRHSGQTLLHGLPIRHGVDISWGPLDHPGTACTVDTFVIYKLLCKLWASAVTCINCKNSNLYFFVFGSLHAFSQ